MVQGLNQEEILHVRSSRATLVERVAACLTQTSFAVYTVHNLSVSRPALAYARGRSLSPWTNCIRHHKAVALGRSGRELVEKEFSLEKMIKSVEALNRQLPQEADNGKNQVYHNYRLSSHSPC